jgi:hypothetical protein
MFPSLTRANLARTAFAAALLGCNGDKQKDGHTGDTDTTPGPIAFDFVPSVRARRYEAAIAPEVIEAHQASSTFLSAIGVVAADPKVQDRFASNGEGGVADFRAGALDCWERPEFPMFSFTLDYSNCAEYLMAGGVYVEDHPSGPLLFSFLDFSVDERTVGGTVSFDTRGAYPEPQFWQMYPTNADDPGIENPADINVSLRTESGSVRFPSQYTGGATIDFLNQQLSVWGVFTTGDAKNRVTVVHGAVDAADVPPDDPRDADVLSLPLNWLSCRCPTAGTETYDMPLHFSEVIIDIDDLEVEPDDVDDPDLVIPVDYDLVGKGILERTGCGEYDVTFDAPPAEIVLSSERLVGVISFQCDTLAINDVARCNALIAAARELGELVVEIQEADATATALAAVEQEFDTDYCRPY